MNKINVYVQQSYEGKIQIIRENVPGFKASLSIEQVQSLFSNQELREIEKFNQSKFEKSYNTKI